MKHDKGNHSPKEEVLFRHNAVTVQDIRSFQSIVYKHYRKHQRILPWRKTSNPYRILVSEIMLQQTQVDRVIEKYKEFLALFPDFSSLAHASFADVLRVWQGLGYNRRAVSLHKIAASIMKNYHGRLPETREGLMKLPGIGTYTASAVLTFAFNKPELFIETNIRSVFIHFFFQKRNTIKDAEILPLIQKTLDRKHPREWYYALMDYGAMLKKELNPGRKSAHYQRQSPFKGSNRQLRGMILRAVMKTPDMTRGEIVRALNQEPVKIERNLLELLREGFLKRKGHRFSIIGQCLPPQ